MAHYNKHRLPLLNVSSVSDFDMNYLNFHNNPLRISTIIILMVQMNIRLGAFSFSSLYFHVLSNLLQNQYYFDKHTGHEYPFSEILAFVASARYIPGSLGALLLYI